MKTEKTIKKYFTKESQKELKEMLKSELQIVWTGKKGLDSKMVDYGLKTNAYVVPICNGKYILDLDKQKIETEFWFGESDMGQGPSHDENTERMERVKDNFEDYFLDKNLSSINNTIQKLEDILHDKSYLNVCHYLPYYSSKEDSILRGFGFYSEYGPYNRKPEGGIDFSKEDVKILLTAYKIYKEDFTKKLFSYLKRYGLKKLHIHSYWIDR